MTDPFARLGSFMYRFRWYVLGAWLVMLGICGAFAPKAVDVLQAGGIEAPGSDSSVASGLLAGEFNVSALNNVAIVLRSDSLTVDDARVRGAGRRCGQARSRRRGRHARRHVLRHPAPHARQRGRAHDDRVRVAEGRRGRGADVRRRRPRGARRDRARALRHRCGGRQPRLPGDEREGSEARGGADGGPRAAPAAAHVPHGRRGGRAAPPRRGGRRDRDGGALPDRVAGRHLDLRSQHRVDDRPRPCHRLLVDRRQPLSRGVSEAQGPPAGDGDHDGDRRPLDRLLGHHRDARHARADGAWST